jgi:hypothetical protein
MSGARWIFQDLQKAQEYVDMKVFCFAKVFKNYPDALEWKNRDKAAKEPRAHHRCVAEGVEVK